MIVEACKDIWTALLQYNHQALTYAVIAVTLYLVFVVLSNIIKIILGKECKPFRKILVHALFVALFGIYLSYLIALTLSGREPHSRTQTVNLVLFSTLFREDSVRLTGVENILLFIPMGILVPSIWRGFRRWWNMVLAAFVASTSIECIQFMTERGYCELDDIIFNVLGAWMGYFVFFLGFCTYCAIRHRLRKDDAPVNRISLIIIQLLMIVLVLITIFSYSSQEGEISGGNSARLCVKIVSLANEIGIVNIPQEAQHSVALKWDPVIRKLAHATEYAILAFTVGVFLYCRKMKWLIAAVITEVFVVITACLDEWSQTRVIGRNGNATDVLIDSSGALVMILGMTVVFTIGRIIEKQKEKK